jgi:hypothetical protein
MLKCTEPELGFKLGHLEIFSHLGLGHFNLIMRLRKNCILIPIALFFSNTLGCTHFVRQKVKTLLGPSKKVLAFAWTVADNQPCW